MTTQKIQIYDPLVSERHELCFPVDPDDYETTYVHVNGEPQRATWRPIAMKLIGKDERGRNYLRSDAPWLGGHALIFRPTVVEAMGELLRAHGELLPLRCDGHELWMFNPSLLDALDQEASTLTYFSDGDIMDIKPYVFRPEAVRGVHAFKIPHYSRAGPTFVSQQFVDQWNDAGLQGLEFPLVWEHPG